MSEQKSWKPQPPYVIHSLQMLQSPAWAALDDNTKRFLERLEIEHLKHGGKDNGKLPLTYNDLCEFGIRREVIPRSIKRASLYGFAKRTRRGRRAPTGGTPSLYQLTYLPTFDGKWPSDEWKHYRPNTTRQRAKSDGASVAAATKHTPKSSTESGTHSSTGNGTQSSTESGTQSFENAQKPSVPKPVLLSRNSTHLCSLEGCEEVEPKPQWSTPVVTEIVADDLDLPEFLRRGHPDCWLKEGS